MKDINDLDVELLFKQLVILKEDRENDQKTAAEAVLSVEEDSAPIPIKEIPSPIKKENTKQRIPAKCLIYPKSLKSELFTSNSNLSKIAKALKIESLTESALAAEDIHNLESLNSCSHLWFVGIEKEEVYSSLKTGIKFLNSPNMERLKSKEDKLKMYEPLKKFAAEISE